MLIHSQNVMVHKVTFWYDFSPRMPNNKLQTYNWIETGNIEMAKPDKHGQTQLSASLCILYRYRL